VMPACASKRIRARAARQNRQRAGGHHPAVNHGKLRSHWRVLVEAKFWASPRPRSCYPGLPPRSFTLHYAHEFYRPSARQRSGRNRVGVHRWPWRLHVRPHRVGREGPPSVALLLISVAVIVAVLWFVRSREAQLEARAEQALPGPLRPVHRVHTG
jgi:hypothetical protein